MVFGTFICPIFFFFFQAEDGIRDKLVTGVQTCALPIYRRGSSLALIVADDGKGFDPQRVLASEEDVGVEGGHFGLRGIQDRVEMLGGTFAVDSAPGRGTSLTVTLPAE